MLLKLCLFLGLFFISGHGFADDGGTSTANTQLLIDSIWVLLCAVLIFFMQAGFLSFEIGMVREKNAAVTAMKNVGDWIMVTTVFCMVGFGIMFGTSVNGVIGSDLLLTKGIGEVDHHPLGWSFLLYHLTFAGTAATVVSGSMAERTGFKAYIIFTMFSAAVIYPVFGHWVWGNQFLEGNQAWLADLGFVDFAGAAVVHGTAGWSALIGLWIVGPRMGRYTSDGEIVEMASNKKFWSCLGTIILWVGWWGFNGGSALAFNEDVPRLIFNTNLAGGAAGLMAFTHCSLVQKRENIFDKTLGGALGGLVAITACCNIVDPVGAICVGLGAGLLHNSSYDLVIKKWKLDDVVGAVPVHAFCGTWGLLCVAFFGQRDMLNHLWPKQLMIQCIGILVCFAWATIASFIAFKVVKAVFGIRVHPMREIKGLKLEHEIGSDNLEDEDTDIEDFLEELAVPVLESEPAIRR